MSNNLKFFIGGAWVDPLGEGRMEVINPATEEPVSSVALGSPNDIDLAVQAAQVAFAKWGSTSKEARLDLLTEILGQYYRRYDDIVDAITIEMGAPKKVSRDVQAAMGVTHLKAAIAALREYRFVEDRGTTQIRKEPIGVCGFITPWNWPINQIVCKVAPAIATGCTMVLKPSEIAPLSSIVWAEIMYAAGTPPGVFNLVNGTGVDAGAALSRHPGVDMVSFTGSTRAGVEVARDAAPTVKRVQQELGGKSANILLPDANFASAVEHCVRAVALNSGQNCNAPTRLLVPNDRMDHVEQVAKETVQSLKVGAPDDDVDLGPVVSRVQWDKIQCLISSGIECGATLLCGGVGRPEHLTRGYYVKPTIFSRASNEMKIAREEIFGPVLTIIGYSHIAEAIEIANDTPYGLASYVSGANRDEIEDVAGAMRSGQVVVNGAAPDPMAPFGGYKQSGNGREWGDYAFEDFLEVKAILGFHGQ